MESPGLIEYHRARFATVLPQQYRYTRAHFWLAPRPAGIWRVGLTKFATRMLGEMVDFGFERNPDPLVQIGQKLGWIEGFKAVSDLYAVVGGLWVGSNPELEIDITWINRDPQGQGWLYETRGEPDPAASDAAGYAAYLDELIDKLSGGGVAGGVPE